MKITQKQQEELNTLVQPLQEWINKNCHPHIKIVVDGDYAEMVEGVLSIFRNQRHRKG